VAHDGRDVEDRPMAGQRYRYAIGLVFGSVAPVAISIMISWSLLDLSPGGFGAALILVGAFLAMLTPYVVGWVRSYLGLVGAAVAVLVIKDAMVGESVLLVTLASLAAVGAIAALVWFSLRLGHVWRPADARTEGAARSTLWPYPYA
jgi:hypothetical protein